MTNFSNCCASISGTCSSTIGTYRCECTAEWEGDRCERRKDYCANIICQNGGVCRTVSSGYQCVCVDENYSGERCEIKGTRAVFLQIFATSISYVSIIIILACSVFIITMDVLKYALHVDSGDRKPKKQSKAKKRHRPLTVIHFVYVNEHERELNTNH